MKIVYQKIKNTVRVRSVHSVSPTMHFHSHIEMLYLLSGEVAAKVDDNRYEMSSGDLLVVFPNQIHSYINNTDINGIILIFPEDFFDDYSQIFETKVLQSSVLSNKKTSNQIKWLIEQIYMNSYGNFEYKRSIIKGLAITLMGEILERSEFLESNNKGNDTLHDILDFCHNNFKTVDLSLQDLADGLHLSKHYISHQFSQKVKMSFSDYVNSLRISEACKIMNKAPKTSFSEIAYEVGFGSIRTFNRAFTKHMGKRPSDYKRK